MDLQANRKGKTTIWGEGMKSLNKALREWLLERRGRGMALAEKLDCSRQYISEISKMETGLSLAKWDEIQWAMLEVESNEQGVKG
ncbi:hypothetical protein [Acinetobacter schindleri]|uniref:hypothetical protein n=1 Tax=Acinetobacter schindleri TaxID=108981 RepID=UPI0021CDA8A9|nr:hypothetical protein [Acinetobacter schindleri]